MAEGNTVQAAVEKAREEMLFMDRTTPTTGFWPRW